VRSKLEAADHHFSPNAGSDDGCSELVRLASHTFA
jgi:hypothetical protein